MTPQQQYKTGYKTFLNVVGVCIFVIAVFGGVGYFIDYQLGTSPLVLIVAVIISFPVSQYFLYHRLKKVIAKDMGIEEKKG